MSGRGDGWSWGQGSNADRASCGPTLQGSQDLPNVPRIELLDRGAFEAVRAQRGERQRHSVGREAEALFGDTALDIGPPPPPNHNPENCILKDTSDRQCARDQQNYPYQ